MGQTCAQCGCGCCGQDDPEHDPDRINTDRPQRHRQHSSISEVPSQSASNTVVNVNLENKGYPPPSQNGTTPQSAASPATVVTPQTIITPQQPVNVITPNQAAPAQPVVVMQPQPQQAPAAQPMSAVEVLKIVETYKSALEKGDETLTIKLLMEHPELELMRVNPKNGDVPLQTAVQNGNDKLVFYLLQNGASVEFG